MSEEVSALLDGELDPGESGSCLDRMQRDPGLRRTWALYQLIGDSLRGVPMLSPGFDAALSRRLAGLPVPLAPRRGTRGDAPPDWLSLSIAASVVGVAVLSWSAVRAPAGGDGTRLATTALAPRLVMLEPAGAGDAPRTQVAMQQFAQRPATLADSRGR